MSLSFDVQNILVLLAGFTGIVYGLIIYSGNKKGQTNLWFFCLFYLLRFGASACFSSAALRKF